MGTAQDPRWALTGRPRLSPAAHYVLMVGRHADSRIHGWVELARAPDLDRYLRAAWREWGESLTAEAQAAGFVPAGIGSKRPRGDAVAQWGKHFLARHTY